MLLFRRVVGDSMLPALRAGQLVLAARINRVRPGNIVIVRHAGLEKIKRIEKISDGQLFLLGDNAEHSTDSRSFGWLPKEAVIAKVVWPKAHRRA